MAAKRNLEHVIVETDILYRKCFVFVLDVIQYCDLLEKNKKSCVAKQLLTTATTFGTNINKLKNATNTNVINKKINNSIKEAEKIKYQLTLCKFSDTYPKPNNLIEDIDKLLEQITELQIPLT